MRWGSDGDGGSAVVDAEVAAQLLSKHRGEIVSARYTGTPT